MFLNHPGLYQDELQVLFLSFEKLISNVATRFVNLSSNQLNEGIATELAKEAEKQGQVLVHLKWDPSDNMVKIFYMPWHIYKYEVIIHLF